MFLLTNSTSTENQPQQKKCCESIVQTLIGTVAIVGSLAFPVAAYYNKYGYGKAIDIFDLPIAMTAVVVVAVITAAAFASARE